MIIPTTIIAAAAALIAIPSIAAPLNPPSSVVGVLVTISAGVDVVTVLDKVLSQGALHVVVKNGDGSVVGGIVPTMSSGAPGSSLNSFATASIGNTPLFGELNRLLHPRVINPVVYNNCEMLVLLGRLLLALILPVLMSGR
jgi:hypothetical protein